MHPQDNRKKPAQLRFRVIRATNAQGPSLAMDGRRPLASRNLVALCVREGLGRGEAETEEGLFVEKRFHLAALWGGRREWRYSLCTH